MLEETFECLTFPQCDAYLQRLGLEKTDALSLAWLNQLIERHLSVIPFEDLTPAYFKEKVSIDLNVIYDKIILHKRGGYCFELNALFLGLLRGLGFEAWPIACRVLKRPGLPLCAHRASIVLLDGKQYFCDVGLGGIICPQAAELTPHKQTKTRLGTFFFIPEYTGWYKMQLIPKGGENEAPVDALMITNNPSAPIDFTWPNEAMCTPPAVFTQKIMVQRLTESGAWSVNDHTLTLRTPEGKKVQALTSDRELKAALLHYFDIEL